MKQSRQTSSVSRRGFAIAGLSFTQALTSAAQSAGVSGIRPVDGAQLETFPDGSTGQISEFPGADGVTRIAAFLRKPKGAGPFPVVVILHGGAQSKGATYNMARAMPPAAQFVEAGFAVVTIDYRPTNVPLMFPGGAVVFPPIPPIELNDTLAAVEAVRRTPSIDGRRIGVMGGSHGGHIMAKVISRADVRCGIICSPAIFDVIELWRALERKVEMIQPIKNKIAEAEQKYGGPMASIAKYPEAYGYDSPMNEAAEVRGAVMIINGRNDMSSPPTVMDVWAEKLRAAGKEVETYMPENAPHGFYFRASKEARPEETKESSRRAVAFVRKHLS